MSMCRRPLLERPVSGLPAVMALAALLAVVLSPPASASSFDAAAATLAEDRLVVVFEPGTSALERQTAVAIAAGVSGPFGAQVAREAPEVVRADGAPVVAVPVEYGRAAQVARRLDAHPAVVSVERDVLVTALDTIPDDPDWGMQWGPRKVGAPGIWDYTTGTESVVVAVIDTGVDRTHPDLSGRVTAGYDYVNGDTDPADDDGHGTAVASIIAAAADDGIGIAGLCWLCRIMPLKTLDEGGVGYLSDTAAAIVYAVDNGADIVNLSLGAPTSSSSLSAAVAHAHSHGVLVVASAGNAGDTNLTYPAAEPGVLAVAATNSNDQLYSFSTHGSWVEVAAPGCNRAAVATGTGTGTTMDFCGTSSAAPVVAGVAALMRSAPASPSADDIASALTGTAVTIGSGVQHGRIDGFAAFTQLGLDVADTTPPDVRVSAPGAGTTVSGIVSVEATATDASGVEQVAFSVDGVRRSVDRAAPYTFTWDTSADSEGDHVLTAEAVDFRGLRATSAPVGVTVTRGYTGLSFSDVGGTTHEEAIYKIAAAGITQGCATSRFCPEGAVTRGQMATFLTRALELPAGTASFSDVAPTHAHAAGVSSLAAAGITAGCDGDRFCPEGAVTRGQMATFLTRALELPAGTASFSDVAPTHAHAAGVSSLAAAGITAGCAPERFCPGAAVTRGQMATFLVRALGL